MVPDHPLPSGGRGSASEETSLLVRPPAGLSRRLPHLESCCVVRHRSAHSLIAAVLLDVGNPLLALGHDLHSFQVKVFVYHLKDKQAREQSVSRSEIKRQSMECYRGKKFKSTAMFFSP